MPLLFVDHFRVPKEGSSEAECEDAIALRPDVSPGEGIAHTLCVAVSDGASESLLAARWSRTLAKHAAEIGSLHPADFDTPEMLAVELVRRAVEPWDALVNEYSSHRRSEGRPVQWYEEPGLRKGAFATLVAVRVQPAPLTDLNRDGSGQAIPPEWEFHAAALGDSCLFHLSNGKLTSFPISSSADFGINPQLLGSRNNDTDLIAERLKYSHEYLGDGDELLLATDALAAWLLRGWEEKSHPWDVLNDVADKGQDGFESWVRQQRADRLMRNDDVALVRIQVRTERDQ